ncbi:HTH domain-containing protein [Actinomyces polynesiensis]|uniref:HTH domain-containing protein n=1 Tax=Actinomyces polynesiensis TaxID=1325934 RepID=UPI0018CD30CC
MTTGPASAAPACPIAATWSSGVLEPRSGSASSRPGRVSAVARRPRAVSCSCTSSHAQAPNQWPGTRRTAERLARELGVSVCTVKRDLDALENSGVPIWARRGPGRGAPGGGVGRVRCAVCRPRCGGRQEDHGCPRSPYSQGGGPARTSHLGRHGRGSPRGS